MTTMYSAAYILGCMHILLVSPAPAPSVMRPQVEATLVWLLLDSCH